MRNVFGVFKIVFCCIYNIGALVQSMVGGWFTKFGHIPFGDNPFLISVFFSPMGWDVYKSEVGPHFGVSTVRVKQGSLNWNPFFFGGMKDKQQIYGPC